MADRLRAEGVDRRRRGKDRRAREESSELTTGSVVTFAPYGDGCGGGQGDQLAGALARLEGDNRRLRAEVERLTGENQRLQARVAELTARVEELRRAAKRQAAPFSKDRPAAHPRRPGRKPGVGYGRQGRRPTPQRVDRVVAVALPGACPGCGDRLVVERIACQYQEDLPPPRSSVITLFRVPIGRCVGCGRRVQPRHPQQTSQALGAAAVQLGPRVVALAAWLRTGLGLSPGKVARLLGYLGVPVSASGVVRAVARAARRARPTYSALVAGIQASPVVAPDETGWRVAGRRAWLWAFVGQGVTVYRVAAHRGFDDAAAVLGAGFQGVLERDGWAPYRKFTAAVHQSCVAHLLRRCRELLADAKRGQAKTPHAVRRLLQHALTVRDARDAGALTSAEAAAQAERLGAEVDKLIGGRTAWPPSRRLLDHLGRERAALFTFLTVPGVAATNWRAEHAIRPAVVARKAWGGNATWAGAEGWQVLASVCATARDQQRDPVALLVGLLRAPHPVVAELVIPGQARGP